MNTTAVDLPVDLNSEDDTGLPWGFLDESQNPSKITQGAWIIAGSSRTQAVAQPRARRPFWSARTCVTGHKPKASNKSLVKAAKLAATVVSDGISDAARVGRKFLASCRWRGVAAGATQVHVARGDRPDVRTYPASAPTSWLTSARSLNISTHREGRAGILIPAVLLVVGISTRPRPVSRTTVPRMPFT